MRRRYQFPLNSLTVFTHDLIILFTCRVGIILPHVCDQVVFSIYGSVFASSHRSFTYRVYLSHLNHRGFLINLVTDLIVIFIDRAVRRSSSLAISIGIHPWILLLLQFFSAIISRST